MSVTVQESGWLRRNRHYVVLLAAGVGSLAAYKAYRAGQDRVQALQATLAKYSDAAASAGDIMAVLSDDLRQFLASESDEVPRSLRQLAKLARSRDVQDTLAACVSSALRGVLAPPQAAAADGSPAERSVVDKVLEALLSDRGHSLVALAIQTAAHTSTDTFCTAVREGLQAAMGSQQHAGSGGGDMLAAAAGASSGSVHSWSPLGSPQQHHQRHHHHHQQQPDVMPPSLAALLAALSSPQVLQLVDGLVSTCVGSAVGAYISRAGSADLFTAALNALGQPGNKELVVDMMSSVSAAFCREMAAACVAPASAVASRPASRLGGPELREQLQRQQQQVGLLGSPVKQLLPHSASAAGLSAAGRDGDDDDDGSEPSTPQSGPGTPEPSVAAAAAAAAAAAGAGRDSFGGSAVAGLVLRRNSFPGLGGSGGSGGGDLASLGPMSSLVSLFVQAARFQEFRSLVVDVSRSSTREFVVSLLPAGGLFGGWQAGLRAGGGGSGGGVPPVFVACMYRVYTMVSVLLFLVVHALGPKTLLGDGM